MVFLQIDQMTPQLSRTLGKWDDNHSLHAPPQQHAGVFSLPDYVEAGVAQNDIIAMLECDILDFLDQRGKDWVTNHRDDDP
jgi:hypothetical protein